MQKNDNNTLPRNPPSVDQCTKVLPLMINIADEKCRLGPRTNIHYEPIFYAIRLFAQYYTFSAYPPSTPCVYAIGFTMLGYLPLTQHCLRSNFAGEETHALQRALELAQLAQGAGLLWTPEIFLASTLTRRTFYYYLLLATHYIIIYFI